MFGNNQSSAQPQDTTAPTNDDDIMQNGSLEQTETQSEPNKNNGMDPNAVFPPSQHDNPDPFGTNSTGQQHPDNAAQTTSSQSNSSSNDNSDLLHIKQQALQQLSPLVQHLDQSDEEKFKTTMMLIQASDNKELIPKAFDAAKNIADDKARAQALLDIINEINYFTQNGS